MARETGEPLKIANIIAEVKIERHLGCQSDLYSKFNRTKFLNCMMGSGGSETPNDTLRDSLA